LVNLRVNAMYVLLVLAFAALTTTGAAVASPSAYDPVALKIIQGAIDLQAPGDLIEPFGSNTMHWKAISVPEVPNLEEASVTVYVKPCTGGMCYGGAGVQSWSSMGIPNNTWVVAGTMPLQLGLNTAIGQAAIRDGQVYIAYKLVLQNPPAGAIPEAYLINGEYRIVVVYNATETGVQVSEFGLLAPYAGLVVIAGTVILLTLRKTQQLTPHK